MKFRLVVLAFILSFCTSVAGEHNIDSLSNVLIDTVKLGKFNKNAKNNYLIIADYFRRTNPFEALKFHYKMIGIAEEFGNDNFCAANYVSIGNIYQDQGLNGRALENFYKAMKYIDESLHGDYCWLYIFIGNVYFSEGLFEEAIEFYETANEGFDYLGHHSEKISDPKDRDLYWSYNGKAVANNNMGLCNRELQKYDKAMDYFKAGLDFRKKQEHVFGRGHSKIYIGEIYYLKGDFDSALSTYYYALNLLDSAYYLDIGSKFEIKANYAECLHQIGKVLEKQGHLQEAESHIRASLDSLIILGDKQSIAFRYMGLAEFYGRNNNNQETIELVKKALDISVKYELYNPALQSCNYLLEHFKKKKLFDKSCFYQEKYNTIKDEVFKRFSEFSVKEVSTRMENEKKLSNLEKDKAIKEYNIKQQRIIIIILSLFGAVVLLGIILFWKKLQIIKKLNNSLAEKNELLIETNNKLSESENELKEMNATKDKFFSIIAHDLKNPFSSFKSLLELMDAEYDEIEEVERRDFISEMNSASQYLYDLLENLLTWSRTQRSKIDFNPEYGNFKQIIESNIAFLSMNASKKEIKLIADAPDDLFATFDANMILTVIRNLVSNAIKFTPSQGTITIGGEISGNMLRAYVKDSGVGMPPEVIAKLFRIDVNHTTLGTNQEKGTGLGLILCKEFIDMHSGRIWAESQAGEGSTFRIEIPVELS